MLVIWAMFKSTKIQWLEIIKKDVDLDLDKDLDLDLDSRSRMKTVVAR